MTDKQWEGMLRMILKIAEGCPTREKIIEAIEDLLKDKYSREDSENENAFSVNHERADR